MGSLGLNSGKSIQLFSGDLKHVEFLGLLYAITMIGDGIRIFP